MVSLIQYRFNGIFGASRCFAMNDVLRVISLVFNEKMNKTLAKHVDCEEVKKVVF